MTGKALTREIDGAIETYELMAPDERPQDSHRDGSSLTFQTSEHGRFLTPEAITLADAQGRWCVFFYGDDDGIGPENRPRDDTMDGRTLKYEMLSHGGEFADDMPQLICVTDPKGRWCFYRPSTVNGRVVRSLGFNVGTGVAFEKPVGRIDKLPRF
jgi:hypothetical protein